MEGALLNASGLRLGPMLKLEGLGLVMSCHEGFSDEPLVNWACGRGSAVGARNPVRPQHAIL